MSLLKSLIIVSEKAANIARICRQEQHLFELLVQEKGDAESNPRFIQDFKTLADVLIQQTVKHDIGNEFPELKNHIKGEENNTFSNKLNETICVEIQNTIGETAKLLEKVLNGDSKAAYLLAEQVHKDVSLDNVQTCDGVIPTDIEFDYGNLGVWIDPIDSTAEYINGQEIMGINNIYVSGLQCVTVLIGVFDKITGVPLIGIINQPFHKYMEDKWYGHCHWGLPTSSKNISCHKKVTGPRSNIICLSSSEDEHIKNKLKAYGFTLVEVAGAGYKMLTVIVGNADAYILSKNTTFKWDTCGPQAVLASLGGDVLKFDEASLYLILTPLEYSCGIGDRNDENKVNKYCNYGGILAYKNIEICAKIINALNT